MRHPAVRFRFERRARSFSPALSAGAGAPQCGCVAHAHDPVARLHLICHIVTSRGP